ncbi:MAG: hypothetical protein GQ574_17035 [Crocinitomix sp.]|nr:hypothetical protein [Crocinitomix sp.]
MSLIQQKVKEGRQLLHEGRFPDAIIESVKEKRLRKDVRKGIFKYDVPFDQIDKVEKKRRAKLLRVQLKHTSYITAKDKFETIAVVIFILGLITAITAMLGMNENLNFGLSSLVTGVALYIIGLNAKMAFENIKILVFIASAAILLEFIAFGWPQTYMEFVYSNPEMVNSTVAGAKVSGLFVMLNGSTPAVYLCMKLMCLFLLLNIHLTQQKFHEEKEKFEHST